MSRYKFISPYRPCYPCSFDCLPLLFVPALATMTALMTERLLANRYQIDHLIGLGGMGQVFLAKDTLLGGVPVAVKFLTLDTHSQKLQMRERFEREAKTCALLGQKSIHIVRVTDYGLDENGTAFYVMEYLQGNNLSEIIRPQPLTLPRFLNLARQISLGLQCAHSGISLDGVICPIIHRDIKPSNIIVLPDASFGELVKILDFGLAKLLQPDSVKTTYYLGTLAYSSPEQMEGKELDNRSDIYSLGVMMFEMLTAKLPFQTGNNSFGAWYEAHHHQSPRSFAATDPRLQIPNELADLVNSCLAKIPSHRPQSINNIIQTLISLEQRYGAIDPVKQRLGEAIISQTIASGFTSLQRLPSVGDELVERVSWPKDKPIADIVFPQSLRTKNDETIAALWAMLPDSEIRKRQHGTRYNQFLFTTSPHPMVLWITVLYSREYGPKWLPHYLDLETHQGQESAKLLYQTGYYRLLLFARESIQQPAACLVLNIAPTQVQLLQNWSEIGRKIGSSGNPLFSKGLLKQEFEKLKPQILMKLAAV